MIVNEGSGNEHKQVAHKLDVILQPVMVRVCREDPYLAACLGAIRHHCIFSARCYLGCFLALV